MTFVVGIVASDGLGHLASGFGGVLLPVEVVLFSELSFGYFTLGFFGVDGKAAAVSAGGEVVAAWLLGAEQADIGLLIEREELVVSVGQINQCNIKVFSTL